MRARPASFAVVVLFAVAFGFTCWAIGRALPFPQVEGAWPKLEYFRQHAAEFDTVFIGSSRIYHQAVPELFEQTLAQRGRTARAFNFGLDGMRPPEDAFYLEQILARHPPHLRTVVIEAAPLRLALDREKRGTARERYWHDWPRLMLLTRYALQPASARTAQETFGEERPPLVELAGHASIFARRFVNLGRGEILTEPLSRPEQEKRSLPLRALGPRRDGYVPAAARPMAGADLTRYRTLLAERSEHPPVADPGDPVSHDALLQVIRAISRAGARAVLVVPPTLAPTHFCPSADSLPAGTRVLDFSNPAAYPALYEEANRLDHAHLNPAGAAVFTRLLAEALGGAE